jgi:hypothetical protein
MGDPGTGVARRVWAALGDDGRTALTSGLAPTDLQSLLLDVAKARASAVTAARLAERWTADRFVRPAPVDPRRLSAVVARMWELLPYEIDGVELSPVTPLGTCAGLGAADQNRVLSTVRNTEVVSDLTNVLALEAARRRRVDAAGPVHLATCHRLLRTQKFPDGWSNHFQLFALVSSDRDHGSGRTEADLLTKHLSYWQTVLQTLLPERNAEVRYSAFSPVLEQRFDDVILPEVRARSTRETISWVPDHGRTRARGYYTGGALLINVAGDELGDGGFTDWTAQLLADRKERCLISCMSTERLAALMAR